MRCIIRSKWTFLTQRSIWPVWNPCWTAWIRFERWEMKPRIKKKMNISSTKWFMRCTPEELNSFRQNWEISGGPVCGGGWKNPNSVPRSGGYGRNGGSESGAGIRETAVQFHRRYEQPDVGEFQQYRDTQRARCAERHVGVRSAHIIFDVLAVGG